MREMKDCGVAWIGKIPHCWNTSKLKYLGQYINGYAFKPEEWGAKGVPIIRIQDLTGSNDNPNYFEGQIDKKYWVENGDILISWAATLDAFIWNKGNGWLNQHIFKAVPNRRIINYDFFFWMIKESMKNMNNDNKHGIFMQHVTLSVFNNFTIPMPPLAEQERIAAFLDAECAEIDAVLEKTRASIEEYKKLKQAVITQAVTKGIRGDRPMKNSGIEWIGDIPAEWDVLNLVAHTSMLTPMRDRPENLDGPIPWVRIEDFEGKYIESSKAGLGVSMKTVKEMNLKVYPVGTILCTSSCIMGKCAIVSRELVSNQRFIGIIPDRTTDKTYLYYLMTSNAERMNFLSTGALQANLSRSAFEHLKVQFPPYSEQQEIAAYLDDKCEKIDELILKKQQYLIEIENYKKSLIYEYVTGKKEVV